MPRFEEQLGVATGNFISWLIERVVNKARSTPLPELRSHNLATAPLRQWAKEVCEKAVRRGLDEADPRIVEAVRQPALQLCSDLFLYEKYLIKRKRLAPKLEEMLTLLRE